MCGYPLSRDARACQFVVEGSGPLDGAPTRLWAQALAMTTPTKMSNVVLWRFEQLVRAGYSERQALELAMRRDIDLGSATKLVRRGCVPETAMRILV